MGYIAPTMTPLALLPAIELCVREAGNVILELYSREIEVSRKSDNSPVTLADQRAETVLVRALAFLTPRLEVVAEENVARAGAPDPETLGERFWLVDPLDGTREFIERNDEFTVNVALIERGVAVLGVVYAPALGRLYAGVVGEGAWLDENGARRAIACRTAPDEGVSVVSSRSHGDAAALETFLQGRRVAERRTAGSSLKLCLLAEGKADLYPRLGRTMEWDIAAGHAVLTAAGGEVTRLDDDTPLRYGKHGFENPHFVARGR
ncbi:MAG: 3(2),5-bisphosphate nucleotidase [Pseudomonadota bacterium]|jgi:3'(2'), 5'-bisphosphate nucleotidase